MTAEEYLLKYTKFRPQDKHDRDIAYFCWDDMIDFAEQYHENKLLIDTEEIQRKSIDKLLTRNVIAFMQASPEERPRFKKIEDALLDLCKLLEYEPEYKKE